MQGTDNKLEWETANQGVGAFQTLPTSNPPVEFHVGDVEGRTEWYQIRFSWTVPVPRNVSSVVPELLSAGGILFAVREDPIAAPKPPL